ncbi:MAG: hypothetical protein EOL97_16855 [Spirochaetia bacterium]|nr:hypothetical protein [Spirochaetia bacterium]
MKNIKMPKIKNQITEVSTVIDKDTGEELERVTKTFKYIVQTEQEFLLWFTFTTPDFIKLTNSAKNVWVTILYKYGKIEDFEIGMATRARIASELGVNTSTVANAIAELKEYKFLLQLSRGYYKINPLYAYRGSLKDRRAELHYLLDLKVDLYNQ